MENSLKFNELRENTLEIFKNVIKKNQFVSENILKQFFVTFESQPIECAPKVSPVSTIGSSPGTAVGFALHRAIFLRPKVF